MGNKVERRITSTIDAQVTARQITRGDLTKLAISPCDSINGRGPCPDRGNPLQGPLCGHEDGLLPESGGGVACPRQKGPLKVVGTTHK